MSCPLNSLELEGMQAAEAALSYVDVCDVERPGRTQQTGGGWTTAFAVNASGVACAVRASRRVGQESVAGGGIKDVKYREIHMAVSVDVRESDRIHLTQQGGVAVSRYYEVVDAGDVTDQLERVVQVREIPHART